MAPVQKKGLRALQIWCGQVTAEYDNVHIKDLSHSFRDGLAFNAIIHHFRPDLFDYKSLKPSDIRENNAHAFRLAERELGVPALLDPEDMVDCEEPDKFSVSTYLAQLYHLFKNADPAKIDGTPKPSLPASRTSLTRLSSSESESNDSLLSSSSDSSPPSLRSSSLTGSTGSAAGSPPKFNRADLIAKYGEDIFSCSSPQPSPKSSPVSPVTPATPPPTAALNRLTLDDSGFVAGATTPSRVEKTYQAIVTPLRPTAGSTTPPVATPSLKSVQPRPFALTPRGSAVGEASSPGRSAATSGSAVKKNESTSAVASVRKQFEAFAKISAS